GLVVPDLPLGLLELRPVDDRVDDEQRLVLLDLVALLELDLGDVPADPRAELDRLLRVDGAGQVDQPRDGIYPGVGGGDDQRAGVAGLRRATAVTAGADQPDGEPERGDQDQGAGAHGRLRWGWGVTPTMVVQTRYRGRGRSPGPSTQRSLCY